MSKHHLLIKQNLLQCSLLTSFTLIIFGKKFSWKNCQGTAKANQQIKAINLKGEKVDEGRLTKIFRYEGTKKVPIEEGEAGDIVIIAGLEKANVADTICDLEIDEPN